MDRFNSRPAASGLHLGTVLMLDIFDEPIVFHRAYVPIAGGITPWPVKLLSSNWPS